MGGSHSITAIWQPGPEHVKFARLKINGFPAMNNLRFHFNAGILLAFVGCLVFSASCTPRPAKTQIDPKAHLREIEQWRAQRLAELTSDSGWLTLIGLFWLKEGQNTVGTGPDNDVVLSFSSLRVVDIPLKNPPPRWGVFVVTNGIVRFETPLAKTFFVDEKPISSLELKNDGEDKPTVIHLGSVTFQIIKRGDKLGLRVKDSMNPDRFNFKAPEFYPAD